MKSFTELLNVERVNQVGGRTKCMIRLLQILIFFFIVFSVFQGVHNETYSFYNQKSSKIIMNLLLPLRNTLDSTSLLLFSEKAFHLGWASKILMCLFNWESQRQRLHENHHPHLFCSANEPVIHRALT